jgi:hypothetical protein
MANKIIIGDGNKKEKRHSDPNSHIVRNPQKSAAETERKADTKTGRETASETVPIPIDENVWGNDNSILHHLDEKVLADRRLFVRIRYLQHIECTALSDSPEEEPYSLANPFVFMISDLSMGGIGIICDDKIEVGKVLAIRLVLDNIPYDVKCQVVYCFQNDDKFRAGLKIIKREKKFIQHLKIFIARKSLTIAYGEEYNAANSNYRR